MLLVGTTGGVFKGECVKRLLATQSSNPVLVKLIVRTHWDPTLAREARVLHNEPLAATDSNVPEAELVPSTNSPTVRTRNQFRDDSTSDET